MGRAPGLGLRGFVPGLLRLVLGCRREVVFHGVPIPRQEPPTEETAGASTQDGAEDVPQPGGEPGLLVAGAKTTGPRHLESGAPCQDALAMRHRDGIAVVAVADGLGSRKHSQIGARRASDAAVQYVCDRINESGRLRRGDVRDAFLVAREAVKALARTEGLPVRELASTLLVACLDHGRLRWGQLGDGAIVASTPHGHQVVKPEMDHDYVNLTYHLLEKQWDQRLTVGVVEDVGHVSLFTDGVQGMPLVRKDGRWAPFSGFFDYCLQALLDQPAGERSAWLQTLLESPRAAERSGDDKAWVMVVRDG